MRNPNAPHVYDAAGDYAATMFQAQGFAEGITEWVDGMGDMSPEDVTSADVDFVTSIAQELAILLGKIEERDAQVAARMAAKYA